MSQMAALRPAAGASSREAVLNSIQQSTAELELLRPTLKLLNHPPLFPRSHEVFARCYGVGAQYARSEDAVIAANLPLAELRAADIGLQSMSLLCAAAGKLNALRKPIAHNRLCDYTAKFAIGVVEDASQICDNLLSVRSIALPVYQRLLRDEHAHPVCLQQVLLHLLAWKSDSPWVRQQAQRLLWQGGILGEQGAAGLVALDNEIAMLEIRWPSLWSLLALTGFLARYPAGPMFID